MGEHLAASDALQRVRDHVRGEGGVLDVAVAAAEVVRVEDAEDVSARLALALDHLLLSAGRGMVVAVVVVVVVAAVVGGRRRFLRGRCKVVLGKRRGRRHRKRRRRALLKVRLILGLLDLFLVCVSEKLLELDWSVLVVIVFDDGRSGGGLCGQRRRRGRRCRKGSEQFGI